MKTTLLGISGELSFIDRDGHTFDRQVFTTEWRSADFYEPGARIRAKVRHDDSCKNGHNSFGITADIVKGRVDLAGGCMHDEIAQAFPELAGLIRWHLTSEDEPLHYVANALYHAGNRDCWGLTKGEPHQFDTFVRFGGVPILHELKPKGFAEWLQDPEVKRENYDLEVIQVPHDDHGKPGKYQFAPKYTFGGFGDSWYTCPFDDQRTALNFLQALQEHSPEFVKVATSWGEGKACDFAAAREAAIWPEATDEQLSLPRPELEKLLKARLPGLVSTFRADLVAAGLKVGKPKE